jgi:molecular chaperone HtpG
MEDMSASKRKFKTELKQLMEIITHSLYSHREIFLRELVSNASDAIDKARFEAVRRSDTAEHEWAIRVIPDKAAGTLTITDNGVGMSRDTITEDLGTIARSGTKAFLQQAREAQAAGTPELIGQFGVGFYSAFMVADEATVVSRGADTETATRWVSSGEDTYTVDDAERETQGTDVVLHLREDAKEYLDPWRLRQIINRFSTFIEYPIVLVYDEEKDGQTATKTETVNQQKAIWLRPKQEITEAEYHEFYKHIAHDFNDPIRTIHYTAEGAMEFRALLFLPAHKPFDYLMSEPKPRLHLYVKRVFITDACETLLPAYLRFVKGMVDSSDLPLNVSRELLQDNPLLAKIQKSLVSRILSEMGDMLAKARESYVTFFKAFGVTLKEGISRDFTNREKLSELLLFQSLRTEQGKYLTLDEYVAQMTAGQDEILYLCGDDEEAVRHSPYLEAVRAKGQDALLLTDPIDPFLVNDLTEFKGKKLRAIDQGDLAADEAVAEAVRETYAPLLALLNEKLSGVKEVRLSTRLKESAACLVGDAEQMNIHMERMMKHLTGQDAPAALRVLELNPEHAAVKTLQALHAAHADDARVPLLGQVLLDEALVAQGSRIADAAGFAGRINTLITALTGESTL